MDESGFMLQPVRRRTWAPKGQTPIHKSWSSHDRLSAVSAISVSPIRRHLGLYFQIHRHNMRSEEVIEFLKHLRQHLKQNLIVIMDRHRIHRKAARLLEEKNTDWLEVEFLPAYAPEINPVEQVWNHSKYAELANFIPENVEHLGEEVIMSLEKKKNNQNLLRSFFKFTKLKL